MLVDKNERLVKLVVAEYCVAEYCVGRKWLPSTVLVFQKSPK